MRNILATLIMTIMVLLAGAATARADDTYDTYDDPTALGAVVAELHHTDGRTLIVADDGLLIACHQVNGLMGWTTYEATFQHDYSTHVFMRVFGGDDLGMWAAYCAAVEAQS